MYNWVTRRKIWRTEETNYPERVAQTVDLTVAKWIPITAALLACAVTPARPKLDVRQYDWSPAFTWVRPVVDATVRTYIPAASTELQSCRVAARPPLDVRRYDWAPESFDLVTRVDALVRTWGPVFRTELASERIASRRPLDLRSYEWAPAFSWVRPVVDAQVRTYLPAATTELQSSVTAARRTLDVRSYEWNVDEASWIAATQTVAVSVEQTAPAWTNQAQQYRTANGPTLDLTRTASSPNFFGTPEDWVSWSPLQDHGGLTRDRARLDVRTYDWSQPAWIFISLPAVLTDAQKWPAILEASGLSYRTPARVPLDVRLDWAPAFSWVNTVTDAAIAKLAGVYGSELSAYRTPDRARLDVRVYRWAPDDASWELLAVAPPATVAQRWPAILQNLGTEYVTANRAKMDVRGHEWQPSFAWSTRVVEGVVSLWAPIFRAELASVRTNAAPALDVRGYDWAPSGAWVTGVLPSGPPVEFGPIITATIRDENDARSIRSTNVTRRIRDTNGDREIEWLG
jgi:hypothetical protein